MSQMPLLQPAQISPTTAAQYPGLAEYAAAAAYGYPLGMEFGQGPAVTAGYPGLAHAHFTYSMPPTTGMAGMPFPVPAEARLQ